ncbi:MAG: hypothetical protein K9G11_01155 [Rickettsiaceae bacterium]|nr:hypothetical protein [Rickettsiaceae bacterium]
MKNSPAEERVERDKTARKGQQTKEIQVEAQELAKDIGQNADYVTMAVDPKSEGKVKEIPGREISKVERLQEEIAAKSRGDKEAEAKRREDELAQKARVSEAKSLVTKQAVGQAMLAQAKKQEAKIVEKTIRGLEASVASNQEPSMFIRRATKFLEGAAVGTSKFVINIAHKALALSHAEEFQTHPNEIKQGKTSPLVQPELEDKQKTSQDYIDKERFKLRASKIRDNLTRQQPAVMSDSPSASITPKVNRGQNNQIGKQ